MKKIYLPKFLSLCSLVVAMSAMLQPVPSIARDKFEQDLARSALQSGQIISFETVKYRLADECGCHILEARLHAEDKHDRQFFIYEIKALSPHGKIVKLEMDARTGNILRMESKG